MFGNGMRDTDTFSRGGPASEFVNQNQRIGRCDTCASETYSDSYIASSSATQRSVPRIMAEDAISFANVLRLFSMSSSFDRRVSRASWVLENVRL